MCDALYEVGYWFSNIFPQKILHFLQSVISVTIGVHVVNFKFLKITLPEKPLMVLYTNGYLKK